MDITLHLTPEIEARLTAQAIATGLAPEALVLHVLEEQLAIEPEESTLSAEEWIADIRAWAESHRRLPYEADDSRESIYEGCGE